MPNDIRSVQPTSHPHFQNHNIHVCLKEHPKGD